MEADKGKLVCGWMREVGGSLNGNTRSCRCCEVRIQAVVDQNTILTKDPMYTYQKPKAKTVEIEIM